MTLSSVLVFIKIKITIVRPLKYIPVKDNNDASTVNTHLYLLDSTSKKLQQIGIFYK